MAEELYCTECGTIIGYSDSRAYYDIKCPDCHAEEKQATAGTSSNDE